MSPTKPSDVDTVAVGNKLRGLLDIIAASLLGLGLTYLHLPVVLAISVAWIAFGLLGFLRFVLTVISSTVLALAALKNPLGRFHKK